VSVLGEDVPDDPRRGRSMSLFAALAWSFALTVVAMLVASVTESARPGAENDVVNIVTCRVLTVSVLLFAMLRVYAPDASVREVLGVRAVSPLVALLVVVAGAAFWIAWSPVDDWISARFPLPQDVLDRIEELTHSSSRAQRVVLFLSTALVLPLCDEIFFRGAVFHGLRKGRPEQLAVVATTLACCASSSAGLPQELPSQILLAFFASWLRGRSGSIVPGALAMVTVYAAPFVPEWLGHKDVDVGGRTALGAAAVVAASALAVAALLARDSRAEAGRLRDA
jgi:membrane protease YdiL (CAAX protease family)